VKDIVERLLTENTMYSYYDSPEIQLDAAREITRLRARVEELERLNRELAEGDALRDEITRYRAGLQKIVDADGFWDAPSLARDLLEGKEKL
jgi:cell division protein FtsB